MREHITVIEVENDNGRFWLPALPRGEAIRELERYSNMGYGLSDIDCSTSCWCASGMSHPSGKVNL